MRKTNGEAARVGAQNIQLHILEYFDNFTINLFIKYHEMVL